MLSQILLISAIISTVHVQNVDCTHEVLKARAYIFEAVKGGNPAKTIGIIDLTQTGTLVKMNGTVSGLKPGLHGFHVHEKGDLGDGCVAAGPHFNPYKMMHGAPDDSNRHVGDLGNIETPRTGATPILISDSVISLTGRNSVIGRAIVIHADVDDLGRGTSELSKTTGNAGSRVACGVIVMGNRPTEVFRRQVNSACGYGPTLIDALYQKTNTGLVTMLNFPVTLRYFGGSGHHYHTSAAVFRDLERNYYTN